MNDRPAADPSAPPAQNPFEQIYREHAWGGDGAAFYSGSGSHDPTVVAPYVEAVRAFLARFPTPPDVVDLGCGDFNVGAQLRDLCGRYTACDVVPALIEDHRQRHAHLDVEFRLHDLRHDPLPTCDVLFLRQVLQHLSNADIEAGLARLAGRCRFLVVTEHVPADADYAPNLDKPSGACIRLDVGSGVVLTEAPFCLARTAEEVLCEVPEYGGLVRTVVYGFAPAARDNLPLPSPQRTHAGDACVLVSYHGTVVTIAADGTTLAHSTSAVEGRGPLTVRVRDGRLVADTAGARLSPAQSAAFGRVTIEPLGAGPEVALCTADGYLSAEPTLAVLVARPAIAAWETYRLRPVLGADLAAVTGPVTPRWREADAVPALLHQTYPTERLPEAIEPSVAALRAANPGYAWRLWTDADIPDFILDHYGRTVLEAYQRINPVYGAARADLFRYLCVYRLGGVYLDIKSSTLTPLATLVRPDDRYLLSQWGDSGRGTGAWWGEHAELYNVPGGEFQQWFVIGAPGHPFLERVINRVLANIHTYDPRIAGVGKPAVLRLTGPIAYTLAILPALTTARFRPFDANRELVYSTVPDHGALFARHYTAQDQPLVLPR